MKQINMTIWFWARILLAIALMIAFFSRHQEPKVDNKFERLQWVGGAEYWLNTQGGTSANQLEGVIPALIINHLNPSARLQLSLRLKPVISKDSPEVYPVGSGVLMNGNEKISILVNSTSILNKTKLQDGSIYLHGTMNAILNSKSKQTNVSLQITGLMGSDEFEVRYPYADKEGYIVFGKGIHTHFDEITMINKILGEHSK
ncbi:hypothetical protein [Paenibacillus qinlingensis]|uniref:Uncharacterized protein n=1 Tax=Paenibacillus qinlingensis TaxID=1837343 RepID=A0ABU1NSL3_9BACL|nr:hypothetical protein [Paenibacillus qinlingensis]MDR6550324.1 hypothetical protein [Paenibacillus qinlingensis]